MRHSVFTLDMTDCGERRAKAQAEDDGGNELLVGAEILDVRMGCQERRIEENGWLCGA